jgi:hypothetical protein
MLALTFRSRVFLICKCLNTLCGKGLNSFFVIFHWLSTEKTSFSIALSTHPCWTWVHHKCLSSFKESQFHFTYLSIPVSVKYFLGYCSFVVSFEIEAHESSNFIHICQGCFSFFGSFSFVYKLKISLSISAKKAADILIRIVLYL